ncbi:GNAT family N-acetyltransferase [Nonomuraea sp. NPDC001023]|uniref:GNAT family N-acetyltransferase n=1 Tax=unclassified Nonomuraea TaxID=2593643 RepID=UPI003324AA40
MSKDKRPRRAAPAGTQLTERALIKGWAGPARTRVRQAVPDDLPAIAELVPLAGVDLDDALVKAIRDGSSGIGLRTGISQGQPGFHRHMGTEFITGDMMSAYLHASLVLVADHRDRGIVGTLIAYPPGNLITELIGSGRISPSEQSGQQIIMLGAVVLTKIKAIAVAEHARGQGVGAALLKRCKQIYSHCGYVLLYGAMPPHPWPGRLLPPLRIRDPATR